MNDISEANIESTRRVHPLLGECLEHTASKRYYEASVSEVSPHFLKDHRVYRNAVLPAAAYMEMVIAAAEEALPGRGAALENFLIHQPLVLGESKACRLGLTMTGIVGSSFKFEIHSYEGDSNDERAPVALHASGSVTAIDRTPQSATLDHAAMTSSWQKLDSQRYYDECSARSIDYGETFKVVGALWKNDRSALCELNPVDTGGYVWHPIVLDACFQALWAALPESQSDKTFLPVGCNRVSLEQRTSTDPSIRWCQATLRAAGAEPGVGHTADVYLYDASGAVRASMQGVFVSEASEEAIQNALRESQTIAVASTFTAEPVESTLDFWSQELGLDTNVNFAPYNQVFQSLLDPASVLSKNQDGVNVLLVNLEDWDQDDNSLTLRVDDAERDRILSDKSTYTLPNRLQISHLNQYETEYLYQELFIDKVYLRHGITLGDDDCVIDVGANIGLFTLFAQQKCPNGKIYSFEPAPHAFDALTTNAALYCKGANVFNCGLSSDDAEMTFTYYPNSSVFSSFSADSEEDHKAIRAVILNMLHKDKQLNEADVDALADEFLKDRLDKESYQAKIRTLSSVIEEYGIEKIDLLKLDAEKSELPVLQGIKQEHWPMIKQMVVEVHDQEGSVIAEVKQILEQHGFNLEVEEEDLLQSSGLYNIYARRPELSTDVAIHDESKIERNIADFTNALEAATARTKVPFVLGLTPPSPATQSNAQSKQFIEQKEAQLCREVSGFKDVHIIDSAQFQSRYVVDEYFDAHANEFGHVPYTPAFYASMGTSLARRIHAIKRSPFKVIVLDCDGTLWRGVVGEAGVDGIEIAPEFVALQQFMIRQYEAGMLLCLNSKNNLEDVWAVFDQRDDMLLKREHIVHAKVNWQPKSLNIRELEAELQVGADSFIFLDDNPIECAEVRANCPEVLTMEVPRDTTALPSFLDNVWAFDQLGATAEDKKRSEMYRQNVQRESYKKQAMSFDEFLSGLNLDINIHTPREDQLTRVSQLTQRTNQFNFTTIRRSETEIQQLLDADKMQCLVVEVSDRFGDYGLVGVLLFSVGKDSVSIDTCLLSCRTLGRGVEHKMIARLGEMAVEQGLSTVDIRFVQTAKNQPAWDFLRSIGEVYSTETGYGRHLSLPAEYARTLVYAPDSFGSNDPASQEDDAVGQAASSSTAVDWEKRSSFMNRVATELSDPAVILSEVEARNKRTRPDLGQALVAPTREVEKILTGIWSEVLGLEQIGIHDNFFELGGKSLLLVQVHSKLRQQVDTDLSPVDLFKYPTIHALADRMSGSEAADREASTGLLSEADERAKRKREARTKRRGRGGKTNA